MGQFSSGAGIAEMNSTLKAISDKLAGGSTSDALSYVGRTVLTPGNVAYGRTDGGIAGAVELGDDATDVVVTIANADGEVLKSRSEEHTSELQSLMRISYAVFCLKKKQKQ